MYEDVMYKIDIAFLATVGSLIIFTILLMIFLSTIVFYTLFCRQREPNQPQPSSQRSGQRSSQKPKEPGATISPAQPNKSSTNVVDYVNDDVDVDDDVDDVHDFRNIENSKVRKDVTRGRKQMSKSREILNGRLSEQNDQMYEQEYSPSAGNQDNFHDFTKSDNGSKLYETSGESSSDDFLHFYQKNDNGESPKSPDILQNYNKAPQMIPKDSEKSSSESSIHLPEENEKGKGEIDEHGQIPPVEYKSKPSFNLTQKENTDTEMPIIKDSNSSGPSNKLEQHETLHIISPELSPHTPQKNEENNSEKPLFNPADSESPESPLQFQDKDFEINPSPSEDNDQSKLSPNITQQDNTGKSQTNTNDLNSLQTTNRNQHEHHNEIPPDTPPHTNQENQKAVTEMEEPGHDNFQTSFDSESTRSPLEFQNKDIEIQQPITKDDNQPKLSPDITQQRNTVMSQTNTDLNQHEHHNELPPHSPPHEKVDDKMMEPDHNNSQTSIDSESPESPVGLQEKDIETKQHIPEGGNGVVQHPNNDLPESSVDNKSSESSSELSHIFSAIQENDDLVNKHLPAEDDPSEQPPGIIRENESDMFKQIFTKYHDAVLGKSSVNTHNAGENFLETVSPYLDKALDTVINQTYGFQKAAALALYMKFDHSDSTKDKIIEYFQNNYLTDPEKLGQKSSDNCLSGFDINDVFKKEYIEKNFTEYYNSIFTDGEINPDIKLALEVYAFCRYI